MSASDDLIKEDVRLPRLREERDRYWQALVDITGLENWEHGDPLRIARAALGPDAAEVGR